MPRPLHIIEPTLENYAGHCYGLVSSLCDAARGQLSIYVWAGAGAKNLRFAAECEMHPYFKRRLRVAQEFLLLRRLFRDVDARIVVTTAKRADLVLARLVASSTLPAGKLSLYFHWFRATPARNAFLRKAATAQPDITILATTESVAETFKSAGFKRVVYLPYPLTATPPSYVAEEPGFRHLLYAGAARQDKGFKHIVDLVELLNERGMNFPVTVQVSAEHYGKYDRATKEQLRRLERIGYPLLHLVRETLAPDEYGNLFRGAICLQPYDREEFNDRASGVTMDALIRGAPIITTSQSWMARQISADNAGVTLDNPEAKSLLGAAESISRAYGIYRARALTAGESLRRRSWAPLLSLLQ